MNRMIASTIRPGARTAAAPSAFATIEGIATLVTAGIVPPDQLGDLVADATAHFLRGSHAPAGT